MQGFSSSEWHSGCVLADDWSPVATSMLMKRTSNNNTVSIIIVFYARALASGNSGKHHIGPVWLYPDQSRDALRAHEKSRIWLVGVLARAALSNSSCLQVRLSKLISTAILTFLGFH